VVVFLLLPRASLVLSLDVFWGCLRPLCLGCFWLALVGFCLALLGQDGLCCFWFSLTSSILFRPLWTWFVSSMLALRGWASRFVWLLLLWLLAHPNGADKFPSSPSPVGATIHVLFIVVYALFMYVLAD